LANQTTKKEVIIVNKKKYAYYTKWYHSVIRLLIGMYGFKDDYKALAQAVYPTISENEAKSSVVLLKKLGLIKADENGVFTITNVNLKSGDEIRGKTFKQLHIDNAIMAMKSLYNIPRDERKINGLTLGLSKKALKLISEETDAFQDRVIAIVNNTGNADRVYQFNFQLFPMSVVK
jgi:uncharacterized protein (TIGR02147 family)